jgi:uncharacterized protein YgiM (DUF1202 family)
MHRLTGLTWMFLFMVLFLSIATFAAVRNVSSIGVDVSGVSRIARGVGLADRERVRDGYDPGGPTPPAAVQAPSAGAGSEAEIAPMSPGVLTAPAATPPGASSAPGAGDCMRIVNTDGLGVVLRTAPRDDARVPRGLSATARVTVLGREGDQWVHVRGENGLEGWVPTRYLAPAD